MTIQKCQLLDILCHCKQPFKCQYCFYHYNGDCSPKRTCDVGIKVFLNFTGNKLSDKVETAKNYQQSLIKH